MQLHIMDLFLNQVEGILIKLQDISVRVVLMTEFNAQ